MKKLLLLLKNIIFAPFIIYIYNLIASPLNYTIPINIFTILCVGFLGAFGLVFLVIIFYLVL